MEAAPVDDDVVDRGLEQVGRDETALVLHGLGGLHERAAEDVRAPAPPPAEAVGGEVGVAEQDPDTLDRHAERLCGERRHHRPDALATGRQPRADHDSAVRVERDRAGILARPVTRRREVARSDSLHVVDDGGSDADPRVAGVLGPSSLGRLSPS